MGVITNRNLMNVPEQFHRYLDKVYEFQISDCYPTIEVEGTVASWTRVPKYFQGKSHTIGKEVSYGFPLSLYIKILLSNEGKALHLIIAENKFPKLYLAGKLFGEAKLSCTRFPKFMTLFKAYETLTSSQERDIKFSSTRHSISHTTMQLTKPNVVKTLHELYGGLEIDLSKFKHRKTFYITLWNLLFETDKLLSNMILEMLGRFRYLYPNLRIIK